MLSKQFFFTLFFILIIVPFTSAQEKEYEFESAYVKKITTTSGSNIEVVTTEEIYISDYGRKSVSYKNEKRKIKSVNKTEESNSVEIINGEWIINYNPDTKEGTKRKNSEDEVVVYQRYIKKKALLKKIHDVVCIALTTF